MKRRSNGWIIGLLIFLALGGGVGFWIWYEEPFQLEVPYDGKTQRQWAKQLYSSNLEERREAAKALRSYLYKFGVSGWTVLALLDALDDEDATVRFYATSTLAMLAERFGPNTANARAAVPKMINLLQDKDLDVRREAASGLGAMGSEASIALQPLAEMFDKEDEWTRVYAAQSWCMISGKSGKTVAVLQPIGNSKDAKLREAVVTALGTVGSKAKEKAVVPLLISFLKDADHEVQLNAVWNLGKTGPTAEEAIPDLIQILEKDAKEDMRRKAAYALSRIDPKDNRVVNSLIQALQADPNENVRDSIVGSMEHMYKNDPRIEAALIEALTKDKDGSVRSGIAGIFAYSKAPPPQAYDVLVKTLRDDNDGARANAAQALGYMGREEVIPLLIELLDDESWFVRWHAILGLEQFGGRAKAAIPHLEKLRNDPENQVSHAAKYALQRIGGGK